MSDDLNLNRLQALLLQLQEHPSNYQISLTNWSLNLVKRVVSLKTNEYEIVRFKNEFAACSSNEEKIKFLLKNEQIKDVLYEVVDEMIEGNKAFGKDWQKARQHRLDGEKRAEEKDWESALWHYWRAIALAPFPGTRKNETEDSVKELPLAFFARAEVLFHLKRYSNCLRDIENALNFGLSFNTHPKLLLLKIKCSQFLGEMQTMAPEARQNLIDALEEYEADVKDPKLTEEIVDLIENIKNPYGTRPEVTFSTKSVSGSIYNGCNKKIPHASASIKSEFSEFKGRHLVSTSFVPGGSSLIIEEPYASVLCVLAYKDYCNHCFKALNQIGFPCETCDRVTFCDSDCAKKAKEYHKYECGMINSLVDAEIFHVAIRTLLVTGIDNAISSYKKLDNDSPSVVYPKGYSSILSLVEHSDKLPLINSLSYTLVASAFSLLIKDNLKLISAKDEQQLILVGAILLRHIKQAVFNGVNIMAQDETEYGLSIDGTKIGFGIYPTLSLVNHNCDPNCTTMFDGTKVFLKSMRNLEEGEEITISYGVQFNHDSKNMRKKELKKYLFECKCASCEDELEIYRDALLCPKCQGAVIYDEQENQCRCLQCNEENGIDVAKTLADLKATETSLHQTAAYFQMGRIKDPKASFERFREIFSKICYSKNQLLLQVKDVLANIHSKANDFEFAVKMAEEVLEAEKSLFGETCIYCVYRLLIITMWKWQMNLSQELEIKLKDETRKVINFVNKVFEERKAKGFVLISSNYANSQNQLKMLSKKVNCK
ncbi:SET and MYND domain-containing protein (SMYD)-like protein [Dinothrombium tinctorium]|uniref:Protein-lysine N-methyltransferase SMYD4 n=1 Tax=Dinothrombium tinctorium TaxID=1965070 RepID=A0A443RAU9_9ACAR|nr:SET and MYND domain-containing protein (SMYD)-like protein [Dinothrombium tinctorium]